MPVADLLVFGFLAGALVLGAISKLRAPRETQDAFVSLRIPSWVRRRSAALALPWIELVLATGLVAAPSDVLVVVAIAVTVLMAAYTAVIARALTFGEPVTCACFGRLGGHRVDRLTLVRNVLLTGLGAWAVVIAMDGGSFQGAAEALDGAAWGAVTAAIVVAATAGLIAAGSRGPTGPYGERELDYLRSPIPFARLDFPDGRTETLRDLASQRARLLVLLSPHCGSCRRTAEHVDGWANRLAPTVDLVTVYPAGLDPALALEHPRELIASDPDGNVRAVFGIPATPAAVLLGADGLLAGGPVVGGDAIVRLVDDVLAELASTDS